MDKIQALRNERDFLNEVLDYISSHADEDNGNPSLREKLYKDAIEFFSTKLSIIEDKIERENPIPLERFQP